MRSGRGARALSTHWEHGGEGALELADAVMDACNDKTEFKPLYSWDMPFKERIELVAREVYGADGVDFSKPFCLGYTGLSDELLQKYIHDSEHLWKDYAKELPVSTLGATIGTHVGPGAIAVAFFEH